MRRRWQRASCATVSASVGCYRQAYVGSAVLSYWQAAAPAARGVARIARKLPAARGGAVAVSKAVQMDLQWWAEELRRPGHKGVSLASAGAGVASHVYADASGEVGWAAWTVADGELLYVYGEWTDDERELLVICEKELLASTWGLVARAVVAEQGSSRVWCRGPTTRWQWLQCGQWRQSRRSYAGDHSAAH